MAPSNKRSKIQGGATGTSNLNSAKPLTFQSLSQQIQNDLIKQPFDIPPVSFNGQEGFDENSIFIRPTVKHSLVIDFEQFSSLNFQEKELLAVLREQYPTGFGLKLRSESNKYIEISFDSEALCREAFMKDFNIQGRKINVIKPLHESIQLASVIITQIPIENLDSVRALLMEVLTDYGDILNLGIYVSKLGGWFTGNGYATLSIDKSKSYKMECYDRIKIYDLNKKISLSVRYMSI